MKTHTLLRSIAALAVLITAAAPAVQAQDWEYDLYVYGFGAGMDGTAGLGPVDAAVVIAGRLADLNVSILELQHRQKELVDQMRDIRPGGRDTSFVERTRRTVLDLERQANARDRQIEQLRSDLNRRRTDLDELRRRIRDLERRRP